MSMVYS